MQIVAAQFEQVMALLVDNEEGLPLMLELSVVVIDTESTMKNHNMLHRKERQRPREEVESLKKKLAEHAG